MGHTLPFRPMHQKYMKGVNWLMLLPDTAVCSFAYLCLQVIELPIKHPELFESLGVAQPKVGAALQFLYPFPRQAHNLAFCFPAAALPRIDPSKSISGLATIESWTNALQHGGCMVLDTLSPCP